VQRRRFLAQLSAFATLPVALAGHSAWAETMLARGPATTPAGRRLTDPEQRLVAVVAEGIIPATDTPGAGEAGVPAFIALLYAEWFLPDEQASFAAGLSELDARAQRTSSRTLGELAPTELASVLETWDAETASARRDGQPEPFFARLRGLVIVGYYSSEVGYDRELKVQFGGGGSLPGGPVFGAPPFKV
jgi:gluconate 2-dehydrogenase gamma chain